jgi:radical SAM superfamily enzyme YgiQ (UPF0313 family)
MKVLLIQASNYNPDGSIFKSKRSWTSCTVLPHLKALAPDWVEIDMLDEQMRGQDIDFEKHYDLVGITAMGLQIGRAFDISKKFRANGTPVILGGTWVTLDPESCAEHADSLVIGECEYIWPQILKDARDGKLKKRYKQDRPFDMADWPTIDFRELPALNYPLYRRNYFYRQYFHWPLLTSRGCPHTCSYCSVTHYYGHKYKTRPIPKVLEEIDIIKEAAGIDNIKVLIMDENPIGNIQYSKDFFDALAPKKIRWASQCTINIARNLELLDLAARSGCKTLTIGFESLDTTNLQATSKDFCNPLEYPKLIREIQKRGINIIALIILGLDEDTPEVSKNTVRFLVENKIALVKLFLPCPFPGTPYFDEMKAAGRILTYDWNQYHYGGEIISLKNFKPGELINGFNTVYREFFRYPNIMRRFSILNTKNLSERMLYFWSNFICRSIVYKQRDVWRTIN